MAPVMHTTTMSDDFTPIDKIESKDAFERTMGRLLRTALQNDVDPFGSWVCTADEIDSDLEVIIVELATDTDSE